MREKWTENICVECALTSDPDNTSVKRKIEVKTIVCADSFKTKTLPNHVDNKYFEKTLDYNG